MGTVFLTRKQYDSLVRMFFKVNDEMLQAYQNSLREWSVEGVKVITSDVQLLQCIDQVGGKFLEKVS